MKKYLITIIIVLIGGFLGNLLRYNDRIPEHRADFSQIPVSYNGYYGVEQQLQDFAVDVLRADITTLRDYFKDNHRIQLFIAYFNSQKYGSQIHSPKHCLPGGGWHIDHSEPFDMKIGGETRTVNMLKISVKEYKAVMFYWFETRSGYIQSEYGLKLDLVKNALLFNPTDAAIVRVTVDASDGNYDTAIAKGIEFINEFYPSIAKSLPFHI